MPAGLNDVCLVGQGLLSAYGKGVEACADGLMAGRCPFVPAGDGFPAPLANLPVGLVPREALLPALPDSRFMALLKTLFQETSVPSDARAYFATTVGDITKLQQDVLSPSDTSPERACAGGDAVLTLLPQKLAGVLGIPADRIQVVSSACASSTVALALAAAAIRKGEISCALVAGCDAVSEFVLSGFSALMAVDADGAKPFDAERRGVTLGEAAAFALLMSRGRAEREGRPALGLVNGWGMTCDANHLTGPSRDGKPLSDAVLAALRMAACTSDDVVAVCAHGTGTVYNDQMEMLAFSRVFASRRVPVFSVKGGMGHTLGAAGLAEVLLALEFLRHGKVPATVGLRRAYADAAGWVTESVAPVQSSGVILTTNSGFGGTNAAVSLSLLSPESVVQPAVCATKMMRVAGRGRVRAGTDIPESAPFAMPRHFGRFCAEARLAFGAVAQALNDAQMNPAATGIRVGVVAFDRDGCVAANRAYFTDYVQSGRTLGRGQLFVYTLPTSVAAECAIACHLIGPIMYVGESGGGVGGAMRAAVDLLSDAEADAFVLLSATPQAATALVVTVGGSLSETALAAEVEAYSQSGC